jgi:hypothetical protein
MRCFIFLHLTAIIVLYKWILTPFFKLRRLRIRDFILLDRHKIEGMCLFDKINCEFYGYANGTARIWNEEIDELADADYAERHSPPVRFILRLTKAYASSLAMNLEQIESSWCPLKHGERAGNVYSDHHENFFPQDKLAEAVIFSRKREPFLIKSLSTEVVEI